MADLLTHAEITILAQTLDTDKAALSSLERLGADNVRALRTRISDLLFDSLAPTFTRVSKLAAVVPDALILTLAERAVPAEVAGRAGGAIGMDHPDSAIALLSGLSPHYMADAAPYVDPRTVAFFAPRIPAHTILPVANELLRRRDYLTASRFVEYATEELIHEFENGVQDDEAIVRTATFVTATEPMRFIFRTVSPQRRARVARTVAAGSPDTILAGMSVLARLDPDIITEMGGELFTDLDSETIRHIASALTEAGALPEFLDIATHLTDEILTGIIDAGFLDNPATTAALECAADTDVRAGARRRLETIHSTTSSRTEP